MRKIAILFPGIRYSVECPLLYFGGKLMKKLGYEVVGLNYDVKDTKLDPEKFFDKAKKQIEKKIKKLDLQPDDQVVFVEKSVGTVLGLWVERKISAKVYHVVLTPVRATMSYLTEETNVCYMVMGSEDEFLKPEKMKEACDKYHIQGEILEGLGHRLEDRNDPVRSLEILSHILQNMEQGVCEATSGTGC